MPTRPDDGDQRAWADDVRAAVASCTAVWASVPDTAWGDIVPGLEWSRWEVADHTIEAAISYALQIGAGGSAVDHFVPFDESFVSGIENGVGSKLPATIHIAPPAGGRGLAEAMVAGGAVLAATVEVSDPGIRGFHSYGVSDPIGFAAMALVEVLVHTWDISRGLDLPGLLPDDALCGRVLRRLSPWRNGMSAVGTAAQEMGARDMSVVSLGDTDTSRSPHEAGPVAFWRELLWITGRSELPGRDRVDVWAWDSRV